MIAGSYTAEIRLARRNECGARTNRGCMRCPNCRFLTGRCVARRVSAGRRLIRCSSALPRILGGFARRGLRSSAATCPRNLRSLSLTTTSRRHFKRKASPVCRCSVWMGMWCSKGSIRPGRCLRAGAALPNRSRCRSAINPDVTRLVVVCQESKPCESSKSRRGYCSSPAKGG